MLTKSIVIFCAFNFIQNLIAISAHARQNPNIIKVSMNDDYNRPELLAARCTPEVASDPQLKADDFRWDYALNDFLQKFTEVYESAKRLPLRNYWDPKTQQLMLPYDKSRGSQIALPELFIKSVQRHIEEALRLGYIDGVFFPDMGHSHFLIPEEKYRRDYNLPNSQMAQLYELFYADPELKIVYHTAEQLKMTDQKSRILNDRKIQWRFFSRNLVGDNRGEGRLELFQNPTHKHNTLGDVPGYYWWGAGFNLSANKNGCLAFRRGTELAYFDLSMYDLTSNNTSDYQWLRLRH